MIRFLFLIALSATSLQAIEENSNCSLILTGHVWLNPKAPDEAEQPYLEPGTKHVYLKAPATTEAKVLAPVIQLAIQREIKRITLSTNSPTEKQATFEMTDIGKFLETKKEDEFSSPLDWGFHCMMSNSPLGLFYENHELQFGLEAPIDPRLLELNIKNTPKSKRVKGDKEQLFLALHQKTTLVELINITSSCTKNGLIHIMPMVSDNLVKMMQIVVHPAPKATLPVIGNQKDNKRPTLEITILKNGQLAHSEKAITEEQLVDQCKQFITKHPKGLLKLSGQQGTGFKQVRKVIKKAKEGGIDQIVFSIAPPEPDENSTIVEQELKMDIPVARPDDTPPVNLPLHISIDQNGVVYINQGADREKLDSDPKIRKLPKLATKLKLYAHKVKTSGDKPRVFIRAHKKTHQQRVVDVLNALASAEIKEVIIASKSKD